MKQIVQNYSTGELRVEEVPVPICRPGGVLVRAAYSLVSAGTERMKVEQARMSLLQKARARPDKVKQVIQSVKQVGLKETYQKVRERLEALTPLGYSLAGVVEEVGSGVDDFAVGDRVACAGEGIACHAEFVSVPRNLCVHVPDGVDLKDAAFATVGAIAMNGVRQAGVTLGDSVLVIGLGLVGLLGVQILKAAGCHVIGIDVDAGRVELARQCGADAAMLRHDPCVDDTIRHLTDGLGVDAAYVAASTSSSDPLEFAGRAVRDRGTVVIVGMVKVEADWKTYYMKELSVVMSRSYGPGRYDRNFEQKGIDYPVGYVKWTQRRHLDECVKLIAAGRLNPALLGPKLFKFDDAPLAYQQLHESPGKHSAGILFEYFKDARIQRRVPVAKTAHGTEAGTVGIGVIGAGNFSTGTLIPGLRQLSQVRLRGICSSGGLSAKSAGLRHGFDYAASDYRELLSDPQIHAVVIATRHDTHARLAAEALRAGKHVFVEKPLALTPQHLDEVVAAQAETGKILMPGYNRRFSPLSLAVRDFFTGRSSPIAVVCRVNAGAIGAESWYQDADEGGWRIVSEGCHFVDLIQFLCGSPPVRIHAEMLGGRIAGAQNDNCIVTLKMQDGSVGTLIYVANGDAGYEKERIEAFGQSRAAVIENWHCARLAGNGQTRKIKPAGSGKGHRNELAAFVHAVQCGKESPLPLAEAVACTLATFAATRSLETSVPCRLNERSHLEADRDGDGLRRAAAAPLNEEHRAGQSAS